MYKQIEDLCFNQNGYIFGGYVRDFIIRREWPNDIDIMLPSAQTVEEFVGAAMDKFHVVLETQRAATVGRYNHEPTIKALFISKMHPSASVRVDICRGKYNTTDFDVNTVTLVSDGGYYRKNNSLKYPRWCVDLHDQMALIESICDKELTLLTPAGLPRINHAPTVGHPHCVARDSKTGKRCEMFVSRGWRLRGRGECETPWCILSDDKAYFEYTEKKRIEKEKIELQRKREREKAFRKRYLTEGCTEPLPDFKGLRASRWNKSSKKGQSVTVRKQTFTDFQKEIMGIVRKELQEKGEGKITLKVLRAEIMKRWEETI